MGELLAKVLPLCIGAAISPAVLTVQLINLGGKQSPLRRAWVFVAGFFVVSVALAVLALTLVRATHAADGNDAEIGGAVKVGAGVLLLVLGVRSLTRAPKEKVAKAEHTGPRLGQAFVLGMVLMATNFSSILLMFPAVHETGIADVSDGSKAVVIAVILCFVLAPAALPPLTVTALGARGESAMAALDRFFAAHRQAIAAAICFAFAVYLLASGLPKLL
ncbi:MAG: GAP family protein [Thermoleophilaceae bacterium]|nr:GAP family protein [Thermoleophilaceae bacterium]